MNDCPCGSGSPLAQCCDPYLSGRAAAPTAEALMRSRYAGYALGRLEYIENTFAPESRRDFDREAARKWSRDSQWKGLKIESTKDGGEKDSEGVVSFTALYSQDGKDYRHEEIASFRKEKGVWYFVDGKPPVPETYVKTGPDLGRNDPCHCGSGKKFKKCHG